MVRTVLLSLSLVVAACGSKPPPAPCAASPKVATADDIAELKARACECTDEACRDAVVVEARTFLVDLDQAPALLGAAHACANKAVLDELAVLRDHACKCADLACAQQVQSDFDAWAAKYQDTHGSEEEAEQAGKIVDEMSGCMQRAANGGEDLGDDEED